MKYLRALAISLLVVAGGCDFQKQADAKFGDQHFKTAIALIELHKVRNGTYPANLKYLRFSGDWDQIAINFVEYRKLETGYELNVTRGWVGQPSLSYPGEFWQGLGLVKSNMKTSRSIDGAGAPLFAGSAQAAAASIISAQKK